MTTLNGNPSHPMCPSCRSGRSHFQGARRSATQPEDLTIVIFGDTAGHWRILGCGCIYEHGIFEVHMRDIIIPNTISTTGPNANNRNLAQVWERASRAAAFAMWFNEIPNTIYTAQHPNVGLFGGWDLRVVRPSSFFSFTSLRI
jgi:hypothetical protein